MTLLCSHASFEHYRKKAWERFLLIENSFPLENNFTLPDEEYFLEALYRVNSCLAFSKLDPDALMHFSMFTAFLLKSTLLFDASFFESMQQKKAKLLLMQADLYLVQGGIEFSQLPNHQSCLKLLDNTLSSIAQTHNIFDRTTLNQRYASIFFCAMLAPYLLTKTQGYSIHAFEEFSQSISTILCLKHHPYLSAYGQEKEVFLKEADKQFLEKIKKFPLEWSIFEPGQIHTF